MQINENGKQVIGFGSLFHKPDDLRLKQVPLHLDWSDECCIAATFNANPLLMKAGFGNVVLPLNEFEKNNVNPGFLLTCGTGWEAETLTITSFDDFISILSQSFQNNIPVILAHTPFCDPRGPYHCYLAHTIDNEKEKVGYFDDVFPDFFFLPGTTTNGNQPLNLNNNVEIDYKAFKRLFNYQEKVSIIRYVPNTTMDLNKHYHRAFKLSLPQLIPDTNNGQRLSILLDKIENLIEGKLLLQESLDDKDKRDMSIISKQFRFLCLHFLMNSEIYSSSLSMKVFNLFHYYQELADVIGSNLIGKIKKDLKKLHIKLERQNKNIIQLQKKIAEQWQQELPGSEWINQLQILDPHTFHVNNPCKLDTHVQTNGKSNKRIDLSKYAKLKIPLEGIVKKGLTIDYDRYGIEKHVVQKYNSTNFSLIVSKHHIRCMVPNNQIIPIDGTRLFIMGALIWSLRLPEYELYKNNTWVPGTLGISNWYQKSTFSEWLEMEMENVAPEPHNEETFKIWGTSIDITGAEKIKFKQHIFMRIFALSVMQ